MKRGHVITVLSIVIFCCFLAGTFVSLISMQSLSRYHTSEFLRSMSNDIYHSVTDDITEAINVSKTIANDSLLVDMLKNEASYDLDDMGGYLAEFTGRFCEEFGYSKVFIASEIGRNYYSEDGFYREIDKERYKNDSWYDSFIELGLPYSLTITREPDSGDDDLWKVRVDSRIESENGTLLGVCGIELKVSDLQQKISDYEKEYDITVLFVDSTGQSMLDDGSVSDYVGQVYSLPKMAASDDITIEKNKTGTSYTITQYIEGLDWYLLIHNVNPYNYMNDFVLIAANVVIYAVLMIISIIVLRHITENTASLHADSYLDGLTGMYNRRAYEDGVAKLRDQEKISDITVVVFDVNGLKQMNDTKGHLAGDALIVEAARLIRKYFDIYGKCYRTGGDEFVAILDKPVAQIDDVVGHFEKAVNDYDKDSIEELSISYGVAAANDENSTIDEIIFLADEQMYERKRAHYSLEGKDRRRF